MIFDFEYLCKTYNLNLKGAIHVGGHIGQEYQLYKKMNIQKMLFFEPTLESFKLLKENTLNDPNALLYNIALGNKTGKETMFIERSNGGNSNSILEPYIHTMQYPSITFNEKREIDIDKLDNIEFVRDEYNFLNLDVQGYELEVLKGAEKTLYSIDYIITEINRVHLYKNCALVSDLDFYLSAYNFKRVETNWAGDTWGDAFYIKNIN